MTNILRENTFKKPWTHSQFLYLIIRGIIRERRAEGDTGVEGKEPGEKRRDGAVVTHFRCQERWSEQGL